MKKLALFTLAIFTLSMLPTSAQTIAPNVQLRIAKAGGWAGMIYGSYDSYQVSLKNKGTDTFYFINATCSYMKAFTTDNKNTGILDKHNCDKDVIMYYSIAPGGYYKYDVDVQPLPGCNDTTTFRLGFIWVKGVTGQNSFTNFHEQVQSDTCTIIWSKRVKFQ